jgi:hypothetical protein
MPSSRAVSEQQPFLPLLAEALGLKKLRTVSTGGDAYEEPQHSHQHLAAQSRRRGSSPSPVPNAAVAGLAGTTCRARSSAISV